MPSANPSGVNKLQSALELLIVYGIALLIIAIAITILFSVFSSPSSHIYNSCSFSNGVTCGDIILGTNAVTSNTAIVVLLNNAGTGYLRSPYLLASIHGANSTPAPCSPQYVSAGGSIICIVNITSKSTVGQSITGTLYFYAQNCAFSAPGSCQQQANQIYAGTFSATTQYLTPTLGIGITLIPATTTPSTNNQKDQLIATVTLFGNPLQGITVNFTANSSAYFVNPHYASTNATGKALSYVWGSKPGLIKMYANFSSAISSNVIISFGGAPAAQISFTPASGAGMPDGSQATATTGSAASIYICAGALNGFYGSEGDSIGTSFTSSEAADAVGIGYQAADGCTAWSTDGNGDDPVVTAAIGVANSNTYQFYGTSSAGPATVTVLPNFLVPSANDPVVITVACGYSNCDKGNGDYIQVPAGCVNQATQDYDGSETAAIFTCSSLAPGSYQVYAYSASGNGAEMAIGAYVFTQPSGSTMAPAAPAVHVTGPTYAIASSIDSTGTKGSYTVNAALSSSSGNYINAASGPGYGLYLCAVAEGENAGSCPQGTTCQLTGLSYSPPDAYNSPPGLDVAALGHQQFNGCSAQTTYGGLASVEVGLNGVSGYRFYPSAQGSSKLTYTVLTSNSFVVITAACAAYSCYGFKLPRNCTTAMGSNIPITADGNESVQVAVCQKQAAGTYNAYLLGGQNNAFGAYVFPPQGSSITTSTTSSVTTSTIPAGLPTNAPIFNLPAVTGCSTSGTIFNLYTGTNQICVNLPASTLLGAVFGSLGGISNAIIDNYTMAGLVDTWYGSSSVEAAVVNCAPGSGTPPCLMEIDINGAGRILNVTTTS